jgi:hypothetical protein
VSRDLAALFDMAMVSAVTVAVPEAVLRELRGQCLRESKEHRANAVFRKLRDLVGRVDVPDAVEWTVLDQQLIEHFDARSAAMLADKNIRTVPLSERRATEYFAMFVERQPPFSEDGRGFGDTMILMSIIDDLRTRGEDGVIVTADRHFSSVSQIAKRFAVDLQALTLDGVRQQLLGRLADAAINKYDRNLSALLRVLSDAQPQMRRFVEDNFELTDASFGLLGSILSTIQSLDRLESIKIHRVSTTPQLWKLEEPNSSVALTISATALFLATVSRWPTRPPRVLRVGETGSEESAPEFGSAPVTVQETFERPILINASVRSVRDEVFDELVLEAVAPNTSPPSLVALDRVLDEQ